MGSNSSKPPPPPPPFYVQIFDDAKVSYESDPTRFVISMLVGGVMIFLFLYCCSGKKKGKRRRSTISSGIINRVDDDGLNQGRRAAVRGKIGSIIPIDLVERARLEEAKVKGPEEIEWIRSALGAAPVLGSLKPEQLEQIVDDAKAQQALTGETIIAQGATGETFFIVGTGTYEVRKDGKLVKTYGEGDSFGELALLYDAPRAATVTCTSEGWLWAVEGAAFREVMVQQGTRELTQRARFLMDTPLLGSLTSTQRFGLAEKMEERVYKEGSHVVRINEPADSLYIVREGQVSCRRSDGTQDAIFNVGDYFGESSLEERGAVRLRDCVAVNGPAVCLKLSAQVFHEQLGQLETLVERNFKRRVLEGVVIERTRLFDKLSVEAQEKLLDRLTEATFQSGEVVIEQGQLNDTLYIIKSGVARVQASLPGVPARGVQASVGRLSRQGSSNSSGRINLSRQASEGEVSPRSDGRGPSPFASPQSGTGTPMSGSAGGTPNSSLNSSPRFKDLAQLQSSDTFGERALLTQEAASARVSVWKLPSQKPLVCYTLDRSTFASLLGSESEAQHLFEQLIKAREKGPRVRFADLEIRRILGVGTFGRVKLAVHKPTKRPYALKCMRKAQVMQNKMLPHVLREKQILGMMDHPFILDLVATYQDAGELYMLEELGLGGELFSVLQRKGKLADDAARFYVASVVSMFTHLHTMKIIYRDLKPENLLLDEKGYLLLVDFGMAKLLAEEERTWTLCGTPEYMAPEVVKHKFGYTFPADWWCVGIFTYECFTSSTPFAADDPMATYRRILKGADSITFPDNLQPYVTLGHDFISALLKSDPIKRLGGQLEGKGALKVCTHSAVMQSLLNSLVFCLFAQVRAHPWFHEDARSGKEGGDLSISWSRLERKEIPPPYIPRINDPLDVRNFDNYGKDEGVLEYPETYPDDTSAFSEWGTEWV